MSNGATLLDLRALPPVPWKNGGGFTRELAAWPPGASLDDFVWRISVADVQADGPFSRFPGVDRVIMLLDGAGMQLDIEGQPSHRLAQRYAPFAFRGDDLVYAQLHGGATTDFNLMLRRGAAEASVDVHYGAALLGTAEETLLLLVLTGAWHFGSEDIDYTLSAGQALLLPQRHDKLVLTLQEGGSALLCVRIRTKEHHVR